MLVRHGQSTWVAEGRFQGRGDPPLSSLGEQQAALVASRLADPSAAPGLPLPAGPPLGIWHSPLQRAAATASAIAIAVAQRRPPPSWARDGLTEIDQGEWQGLTHHEVQARWASTLAAWRHDPTTAHAPGGESLLDAQVRVRTTLASILAEIRSASVPDPRSGAEGGAAMPWAVIVAHDGVLRLALMTLLGVPPERFWSFPFLLCGMSVLEVAEGRAILLAHNLADHLASLMSDEEQRAAGPLGETDHDRGGAL